MVEQCPHGSRAFSMVVIPQASWGCHRHDIRGFILLFQLYGLAFRNLMPSICTNDGQLFDTSPGKDSPTFCTLPQFNILMDWKWNIRIEALIIISHWMEGWLVSLSQFWSWYFHGWRSTLSEQKLIMWKFCELQWKFVWNVFTVICWKVVGLLGRLHWFSLGSQNSVGTDCVCKIFW